MKRNGAQNAQPLQPVAESKATLAASNYGASTVRGPDNQELLATLQLNLKDVVYVVYVPCPGLIPSLGSPSEGSRSQVSAKNLREDGPFGHLWRWLCTVSPSHFARKPSSQLCMSPRGRLERLSGVKLFEAFVAHLWRRRVCCGMVLCENAPGQHIARSRSIRTIRTMSGDRSSELTLFGGLDRLRCHFVWVLLVSS